MSPWASITAWQRHLMLATSGLIVCWGVTFHSPWRVALRWLRFWGTGFPALAGPCSLVLRKCSLAHARPPRWRKLFQTDVSWHLDPLIRLQCSWSWVAFIIRFCRALLTSGHQFVMWPKDVHFHACLWLSRSLGCNLLMTLGDTQSSVAIYVWTHPVWRMVSIYLNGIFLKGGRFKYQFWLKQQAFWTIHGSNTCCEFCH